MNRLLSSAAVWKPLLLAVAAVYLVLDLWAAAYWERQISPTRSGDMLVSLAEPDENYRTRIKELQPNSPLMSADAKVGDSIRYDHPGDSRRSFGVDEKVGLTIYAASGEARHVLLRPVADPNWLLTLPTSLLQAAAVFWMATAFLALLLAVVITLRRSEDVAMRAFVIVFLCRSSDYFFLYLPGGAVQDFSAIVLKPTGVYLGYACFLYFSLKYPPERQLMRRPWIRRLFRLYVVVFGVVWVARMLECARVLPWPVREYFSVLHWSTAMHVIAVIASLSALWNSWRGSRGQTRQKLAWIGLCIGVQYANYGISNVSGIFGELLPVYTFYVYVNFVELVSLLCLSYALLRHRLFDFGFAVNRALVFTIISSLLLVLFALTEFAVDKLLHFEGREKNVIFDALVALGVILCFHRVQHWVRHYVDHTFFHHWYEAAEKLRQFLDKMAFISDSKVLQQKFLDKVKEFSGARGVAIYEGAVNGDFHLQQSSMPEAPAVIDRNNDAMIELFHSLKCVELGARSQAVPGELLLPILVRGRLNGAVLLAGKPSGHQYRPDELTLLASSAQQLGHSLESLRVEELERHAAELAHKAAALEQHAQTLEQKSHLQEYEAIALRQLARVGVGAQ